MRGARVSIDQRRRPVVGWVTVARHSSWAVRFVGRAGPPGRCRNRGRADAPQGWHEGLEVSVISQDIGDGPASVLEPRSRRPKSSPSELTEEAKGEAVHVRAALVASGLDHGPISVHDKMRAMGLDVVPSVASPALDSSRSWSSPTATRSPSPIYRARSSSSSPAPQPESPTSATAEPSAGAPTPPRRHRSPDTGSVTHVPRHHKGRRSELDISSNICLILTAV